MAAHTTFAGLRRLAARAGLASASNLTEDPAPAAEGTEGEEGEDEQAAGDPPAGDPPAGDPATGDEGEGDDPTTTDTGDDPAGGGEPAGATASGGTGRRSADFLAGQRHGAIQTAGRFAAVLASPVARANLEMATDLLASSNMTPSAIIEHCDRYKGESSARSLLDRTPKPNLGADRNGGKSTDDAAGARKTSVERVNKRGGRQASSGEAPVRRSRRAAAAGQQEK